MKVRTLIIATALVSSLLGGIAVYIALTVPNDIRAASLMRDARGQLAKGNEEAAHSKLTQVVQQYPRTDAAAAATVALIALADTQRKTLEKKIVAVEKENGAQRAALGALAASLKDLNAKAAAPPPAAKPAPATKPVVKKAPPKKTTRKAPTKRRTTRRRRR